jgi:hypothetical protein
LLEGEVWAEGELLVVAVDLKDVLSDQDAELLLGDLGKVRADVPSGSDLFGLGLTDASVVVAIFEEKDSPILFGVEVDESEEIVLTNILDDKVDLGLSRVIISFLCIDPNAVEVCIDHFAAKLLESAQKDVETLGHQLVHEPV